MHDAMHMDTLAERLRRRPAKPMGSPRVGSNPTGVDFSKEKTSQPAVADGASRISPRGGLLLGCVFETSRSHIGQGRSQAAQSLTHLISKVAERGFDPRTFGL